MKSSFILPVLLSTVVAGPVSQGYLNYTTVTGYFAQDDPATNASTFSYSNTNFGLLNKTYTDQKPGLTQWQAFNDELARLNSAAPKDTSYKLVFFARHAEGYHNAAETFYGTPAWNCYWSLINGNATASWIDADLTPVGVASANAANAYWKSRVAIEKITVPEQFYTSPLQRCLHTAKTTFGDVIPGFAPTVKEYLREGVSLHTCDHRSNKTWIQNTYPSFKIEDSFTEYDQIWNGVTAETNDAQDVRSKNVLDQILGCKSAKTIISVTSHSGEISSLLRVIGHRTFSLSTGAIIPVLVKVQRVETAPAATTASYTTSAHCTVPPLSSASAGCVCPSSAAPTTTPLVTITPTVKPFTVFTTTVATCPTKTACKNKSKSW